MGRDPCDLCQAARAILQRPRNPDAAGARDYKRSLVYSTTIAASLIPPAKPVWNAVGGRVAVSRGHQRQVQVQAQLGGNGAERRPW